MHVVNYSIVCCLILLTDCFKDIASLVWISRQYLDTPVIQVFPIGRCWWRLGRCLKHKSSMSLRKQGNCINSYLYFQYCVSIDHWVIFISGNINKNDNDINQEKRLNEYLFEESRILAAIWIYTHLYNKHGRAFA